LIEELSGRIEALRSTHGARGELEGIGVAVSGMVDDAGTILYAPQLGWRLVPLRDELAEATGLPVHVENASNACALGHMWLVRQAGASAGDFAYVNVSDGVGVGLVVGGQLVRGSGHAAGEFGHIPIESNGPVCLCGSRGCWEIFTSNLATLARYLGHEPSAAESRRLMRQRDISMRDVVARARAGDAAAVAAIGATAHYLGIGLGILVNTLNPARIIVGGEICGVWELVADELADSVAARGMTVEAQRTPIVPEAGSVRPRLRGAIALVAAPLFAAPQVA
jgi:predicted NBD/HSP70 family sugar kinase